MNHKHITRRGVETIFATAAECRAKRTASAVATGLFFSLILIACSEDEPDNTSPTQELYPHTTFDLDEYTTSLNKLGEEYGRPDLGVLTRPAIPALPEGPLTATTAATSSEVTSKAAQGKQEITLTANCTGTVFMGLASDVTIKLSGFTIDNISLHTFGSASSAAKRILILGPGRIGSVTAPQSNNGYPTPTDILIDGVSLSPDFKSTPSEGGPMAFRGDRVGVVNCILRGYSAAASGVAGPLMNGDDIFFFNTNIGAGLNAILNDDDWGYRMSEFSNRHLIADCMIRSRTKPCVRQGGAGVNGRVLYSSPDARGTNRMMTLYNSFGGSMDASIPQPSNGVNTVQTDNVVNFHVRWFAANESGGNVTSWGPHGGAGLVDKFYIYRNIDLTGDAAMIARLSAQQRASREQLADPGETWDHDSGTNTENTVTQLSEPEWPEVVSPTVGAVGRDPYRL